MGKGGTDMPKVDTVTRETKEYFEGKINWIDVSDYHGVDPSIDFTYSVRVDAKLNKDFRQLVKNKYGI